MNRLKNKRKRTKQEIRLMDQNLELARKFMLSTIKNPGIVKNIPSEATIILYPVKV